MPDERENTDFWRRAGVVWAGSVLWVVALFLPAVRIDDGLPRPGAVVDTTVGSPSGWRVFWVAPLYAGADWRFVAWLSNPLFVVAMILLLAGRVRGAAGFGTAALALGAASWLAVCDDPERWLLGGSYVWQSAQLLVAGASWWWVWRSRRSTVVPDHSLCPL